MSEKYKIGAYEKAFPDEIDVKEIFSLTTKYQYDFLELSIDRTEKRINRLYNYDYWKSIKELIDSYKCPVGSLCISALSTFTLGNYDAVIEKKAIDIAKRSFEFAEYLGTRIVQIPGCDMPKFDVRNSETDKRYMDNLAVLVEEASKYGVVLGIENMENDYMDTVDKIMRPVRCINNPYLQLYPDSGNIYAASKLYSIDPIEDMRKGIGHYVAFHLKEVKENKYGGLFYGEGIVDFEQLVNEAWKIGVRRFVLEYWYTGNPAWKEDLRLANYLCRKWVEKSFQ